MSHSFNSCKMAYRFKDSPGKLTQDLSGAFGRHLLSLIRKNGFDVSIPEWSTLSFLSYKEESNQKEIAEFLGAGKVYVKRLIDRMEAKKLVRRSISQIDLRYNIVNMTSEGVAIFEKIKPLAENTIQQACKNISAEEYRHFVHIVEKMKESLTLKE